MFYKLINSHILCEMEAKSIPRFSVLYMTEES